MSRFGSCALERIDLADVLACLPRLRNRCKLLPVGDSRSRALKWVFPTGAILNVGGVFLYALLEWHSFENTQDWEFALLSATFIPTLLVGTVQVIVGSFLDRRRLPVAQTSSGHPLLDRERHLIFAAGNNRQCSRLDIRVHFSCIRGLPHRCSLAI